MDQKLHFMPSRRYRRKGGWSGVCREMVGQLRAGGGYILGTFCRYFYNVCIKEPRVLTEHRMILAELKGVGVRINRKYCKGSTTWIIVAPKGGPMKE